MTEIMASDSLGPEKIVLIRNTQIALDAILVVDNVAAGPSIGGIRMAPDVTLEECRRLARAMTLKNAAAELPHGGGKAVITADQSMPETDKAQLIRAFAQAVAGLSDYIPGPDMGTNETAMAWIKDEIGRSVGLPRLLGGIPLDEIGATGHGLAVAIETAQEYGGVRIEGARVAVHGFGAVGMHAARNLSERGAQLIAVSDSAGSIMRPEGLDLNALLAIKRSGGKVGELDQAGATKAKPEAVIGADCDILIPAARPDVIRADNVKDIKARLIAEGANIPTTADADIALHARGVLVIPDFIANAGGVICASVEYHGGSESQAMSVIADKISRNVGEVLAKAREAKTTPREAAVDMARSRVEAAMRMRRFA